MVSRNLLAFSFLSLALTGCVLDTKVVDNPDDSSTGGTTDDPGVSTSSATDSSPPSPSEPGTDSATTTGADPSVGDPTATDGTNPTLDEPDVEPCIETSTSLALDQLSPGGFSAEQLFVDKLGPRASTLLFASEPLSLSDQWKNKALPVTVELRYEGGPIAWIDSEFNPDYNDSGEGIGVECNDRLEVGVEIDFVTAAGEFDEHRQATIDALTVERATSRVDLFTPPVAGTFDVTTLYSDPEWVSEGLEFYGTWDGTAAGGDLLNVVKVGGDDGFFGAGTIAQWGDEIL